MKRLVLLLSIIGILGFAQLHAQNWRLFNTNYKYNYGIDNTGDISHTIFADSFHVQGTDTLFFLNRIINNCDTCAATGWFLKDQAQFLQKVVLQNDSTYSFGPDYYFTISPFAQMGDSWQFDTVLNLTASVSSVGPSSTFGQADSFKIISLSNGKNIALSKQFGILQFPDFDSNTVWSLKGVNGINLGTRIPGFYKFFNFQIGDVFQYEEIKGQTGFNNTLYYKLRKIEILSKNYVQGIFTYTANVDIKGWTLFSTTVADSFYVESYIDTLEFIDSAQHICNAYNNKAIPNLNLVEPNAQPDSVMYGKASCFLDNQDTWNKGVLGIASLGNPNMQLYFQSNYQSPNLHPDLLSLAWYDDFTQMYKAKLGETCMSWQIGTEVYSRELVGYVKNGDTTGLVYNDQTYLSVDPISQNNKALQVYPNPMESFTNIQVANGDVITRISIFDVNGRKKGAIENINAPTHKLYREQIPKGFFFLKVETKQEGVYWERLVVI